jgi:two-component system, sensor histidine kinase and response regulator
MLGFDPETFIETNAAWIERLHPDDIDITRKAYSDYINGKSEVYKIEFRQRTKQGDWKWILSMGKLVEYTVDGKPLRMLGTYTDISDRKQMEIELKEKNEQLYQLNATKDKFFTIIAHDLRSPFNTIVGFSELLLDLICNKNYENIKEYAELIHNTSKESLDLLQNLMEWARSQTGRIEYKPVYFDMVTFISEAVKLFELVAKAKNIVIKKQLLHEALVFADKEMVLTILRNLLFNAIKFTRSNGLIVLSVKDSIDRLLISVADNGVGIEKNKLEKLFKIEENITTLGTNNEKGTGFGLLLCKEFVEKHGGTIWVESEEGKGSTIYFTLPYQTCIEA